MDPEDTLENKVLKEQSNENNGKKSNFRNKRAHPRFKDSVFGWIKYQAQKPIRNSMASEARQTRNNKRKNGWHPIPRIFSSVILGMTLPEEQKHNIKKFKISKDPCRLTKDHVTYDYLGLLAVEHAPLLLAAQEITPSFGPDDWAAYANLAASFISNAFRGYLAYKDEIEGEFVYPELDTKGKKLLSKVGFYDFKSKVHPYIARNATKARLYVKSKYEPRKEKIGKYLPKPTRKFLDAALSDNPEPSMAFSAVSVGFNIAYTGVKKGAEKLKGKKK